MNVGSLLDYKKEIATKQDWQPSGEASMYRDAHFAEFQFDLFQFQNSYKLFNDRSPQEYFELNQEDSVVYVPPPLDPRDWRNHMRWNEQRDKFDALLAFLLDLNFKCEPAARDLFGTVSKGMGDVADGVIAYAELLDNGAEKNLLADYAMYRDGTVAEEVTWVERSLTRKIGKNWNPKDNPETFVSESRSIDGFIGIETNLMKLNRVYLGDVSQAFIEKQPHVWKEYVIPYSSAYAIFKDYYMWKFIKPYRQTEDAWTDNDVDIETEEKGEADKVRVRIYENIERDEYAIYINRVLMTPVGMRMPETGSYSITWQRASVLDPHFAYGRSFLANMRPFTKSLDLLRNIFIDRARQGLEPPMVSRFRFLVNKYMFKPASVIQNAGEGGLTPLIPEGAMNNFVFEAMKMLETNIDKASISPSFQGQNTKGQQTKYEVEQQLINSIRAVAGLIEASVNRRKQRAQSILRLAMKYYPKVMGNADISEDFSKLKKVSVLGSEGLTRKTILFSSADMNAYKVGKMLAEKENVEKAISGDKTKHLVVDSSVLDTFKFVIDYRVNPQQRDSRSADMANLEKKYNLYMANPGINQEAVTKMLVRANNDDEQEFVKPPAPPMPPQQPGAQPPAPGAARPPQMGTPPEQMPGVGNPKDVAMQAAIQ